jgi:hypothetical protein
MDLTPAIFCIPDLTGFTRFMTETNIEFSRKVVPPILRTLVNSNKLNFKLGEIEGDAVFFYQFGTLSSLHDITEQCKTFYLNFNKEIGKLKNEFADDYKKIISSSRLGLKIILHYGEITSTMIGGREKLIGEEVIEAHKLLKNSVQEAEYILMSEKFLSHYAEEDINSILNWTQLVKGSDTYEHIGEINYRYINLEPILIESMNIRKT